METLRVSMACSRCAERGRRDLWTEQTGRGCGSAQVSWPGLDSRSLLSGEALEENLRLAVDAQVVDGLRVGGRGRAVGASGQLAQSTRRHVTESLHLGEIYGGADEGRANAGKTG